MNNSVDNVIYLRRYCLFIGNFNSELTKNFYRRIVDSI